MTPVDFRLETPATHRHLNIISAALAALLEREDGIPEVGSLTYNVQLAVQEICSNVVDHAYEKEAGTLIVVASVLLEPRRLRIEVHHGGRPFNPEGVTPPELGSLQVRGYGLFIASKLMDDITYTLTENGSQWQLTKRL